MSRTGHAGGYVLGSAEEQILTVRRYLSQACMQVPLDVHITAMSGSTALVWIADMDCRILPAPELIDRDAYAADGVTYLFTVVDLDDDVVDTTTPDRAPAEEHTRDSPKVSRQRRFAAEGANRVINRFALTHRGTHCTLARCARFAGRTQCAIRGERWRG